MEKENLIIAIIAFLLMVIYFYLHNLFRLASQNSKKSKNKKDRDIIEIKYLCLTNNLDKNFLLNKKMLLMFSIVNALIIDLVFMVVMVIKIPIFLKLIVGFVLFLGLIYSIYGIIGKILIKKGYEKK